MSRHVNQIRKYRDAERSVRVRCGSTRARYLSEAEIAEWFTRLEEISARRSKVALRPLRVVVGVRPRSI